jgi:hypothetical protein
MLGVLRLNVVMLGVILASVVAPFKEVIIIKVKRKGIK